MATNAPDGSHRIVGRASVDLIKSGGYRIGAGEIEGVLLGHPAVAECAVVGVPDDKFGQAITAVVEPAAGATVDEASLIAEVKAHLAPYKAPKRVLVVDTIGRAPNGKVDYKRHLTYALDVLGIEPSPIPVANA